MANFDLAFAALMENEGSTLLSDPQTGECSRFGITLKTAAAFGLCAPDEKYFIQKLTEDCAKAFYLEYYWVPMRLARLCSQPVANKLLDMDVNMGAAQGVKLAQRALNALGAQLRIDGVIGDKTMLAANAIEADHLLLELRAESLQFYRNLVAKEPDKYEKYWEGWKERAEK